jgi:hypothetical protein
MFVLLKKAFESLSERVGERGKEGKGRQVNLQKHMGSSTRKEERVVVGALCDVTSKPRVTNPKRV